MSSSPSSGLSAEAKEFVPLVQTTNNSIPMYVDENTVATIYPSEQSPFVIQNIYPMMIGTGKMIEISNVNLAFPEVEFHIQPSQQQQIQIESSSHLGQNSSNPISSTNNSQIVLLPTTPTAGFYPQTPLVYSNQDTTSQFYPIDFSEQALINFSIPHVNLLNKTNRIAGRSSRPNSFRSQHGNSSWSYRSNRNSYYDYHPRRNGASNSTYPSNSNRQNASNSKRTPSSYHQQEYNNYHHHSSTRSRPYGPGRSTFYHDDRNQENAEFNNHGQIVDESLGQPINESNDEENPFEFRPEDFPSLPINQPSDKTASQTTASAMTRSTSSWNAIVSATRPHSTSPHHTVAQSLGQSQDQRTDRSRSFNTSKSSSTTDQKKSSRSTTNQSKSTLSASKSTTNQDSRSSTSKTCPQTENETSDDGFIQTKQQQRRLKRRNRMKEDFSINQTSDEHSVESKDRIHDLAEQVDQIELNDRKSTSIVDFEKEKSDKNSRETCSNFNEKSLGNGSSIKSTIDHHRIETDRNDDNLEEDENHQNSSSLSSNSTNSSDTSDYDDAVDNLTEQ